MTVDKEIRQNIVLEAIVKTHISNALPVSSKFIAKMLGLSSATIRNVMAELEKAGYVKQPYTSAGRIPTDLGYRKYVDTLTYAESLSQYDVFTDLRNLINRKRLFDEIIESISETISKLTKYMGIAISPRNKIYFDGIYHMLEQPDFRELKTIRDLLRIIEEEKDFLYTMKRDPDTEGITIRIGRENRRKELKECTIITSTYRFKKRISGNIGIIGPMRMRYKEVVPIVRQLASVTTEILEGCMYE